MKTLATTVENALASVASFDVEVCEGRDVGASARSVEGRLIVGTGEGATLRLSDPTVSRFHTEFEATPAGVAVRDLGSTNGTHFQRALVRECVLRGVVEIEIGRTRLRLTTDRARGAVALSPEAHFGELVGASAVMRALYVTLGRAAPTTVPVLILGESGTGKELAAHAIHAASPRARNAFEVVDCTTLPGTLAESILFGHERDAFTGAGAARPGAFERAHQGTIFIDELGELPLDTQAKLLRALGEGEVRRVGAQKSTRVDVRVVAATNRDLRREVNVGRFRADLYYRLAVVQVHMPALRERFEDLALIIPVILERIRRERRLPGAVTLDAPTLALLTQHPWPGNVRELRNWLEQYAVLQIAPRFDALPDDAADATAGILSGLHEMPLRQAKQLLTERFERAYLRRLLDETHGNQSEVARRANVDRATVFRALRRLGGRGDE